MELQEKLGLYQVFVKLYQHNQGLLNEILQLEQSPDFTFNRVPYRYKYILGVIEHQNIYLITNLLSQGTGKLFQGQNIWTIGRGQKVSISLQDHYLSRYHAALQYVREQGFYLYDLESKNGTYVNQEPMRDRILLQDGDRVRMGSVIFSFFLCHWEYQASQEVPREILAKLEQPLLPISGEAVDDPPERTTDLFLPDQQVEAPLASSESVELSPTLRAAILDRFFNRDRSSSQEED
ncbi:FHA domain-containing protein [Spirulina sp. CS-785/01]|uniref:FHA domain-containing protein n=1 Tax=Spirulina sp. CS-785/01 TaxID=3021716 RepID=UPI00232FA3D7|nr:FHA domain-containing protein [Spirulina sp. CS-785/01]MDB9313054.1 FHA domain-containing protein [Spirulina sp. CS-785/01]